MEIDPAHAAEKSPETVVAVCDVIDHWKFVQLFGSGSAPAPAGAPEVHTPSKEPVADEGPADGTPLGDEAVPECWKSHAATPRTSVTSTTGSEQTRVIAREVRANLMPRNLGHKRGIDARDATQ